MMTATTTMMMIDDDQLAIFFANQRGSRGMVEGRRLTTN